MKSSDRAILLGLAIVGLLAGFWFLVLAPKRDEVAKLDEEIASVRAVVTEQEQLAAMAEQAKENYESDYHQLVVLGKAVPADGDQASLLEQTYALAGRSNLQFRGITLSQSSGTTAPQPAASETTTDSASEAEGSESASTAASAPAPATEAAAASLPIGATVGPAGLPVMPYDLEFGGSFFDIADFMAGLDGLVRLKGKGIGVDGRLVTVDGFSLGPNEEKGFPHLDAALRVTTYIAPADQGLTGGSTPGAPAATPPATSTTATTP